MFVDISSICNGNNSVAIRAFAIENRGGGRGGGNHRSPRTNRRVLR